MASVQIADIYNPVVFAGLTQEAQIELNRFIASGVAVPNATIQSAVSPGGNTGELTNFNPLDTVEPNYSDDVPANLSVAQKIATTKQRFRSAQRNKSYSVMDLADQLALQPALATGAITGRFGFFWARDDEQRTIASCLGVLADNIANDAGDMVVTVGNDAVGAVVDAERISANVVIDAQQTMGDHSNDLTMILMPSIIYARLKKQNLITFIPNARGEVNFPTYLGLNIIVDDSAPVTVGANRNLYTCILFGSGVFGTAMGRNPMPSELFRDPASGNGGGQTLLWSRVNNICHPLGFDFTGATITGQSASYADLAATNNWNRIWNRKNIPLAFLQVND